MKHFHICIGTVFGGAQETARAIKKAVAEKGYDTSLHTNPSFTQLQNDEDPILICTSTTGSGEVPANIAPLYETLTTEFPNIVGRIFGVICLGDSSYGDTFCGAGKLFDEAFSELAAQHLSEPLFIDAMETTEPEQEAVPWVLKWIEKMPDQH